MIIPPNGTQSDCTPLAAQWIGQVPYEEAYHYQRFLHGKRLAGEIPDTLVLLEHPLVYTLPRRSQSENRLVPEAFLRAKGAAIHPTDRGGEVTLHNPGQLVGYLILSLESGQRDLHSYLRWIENRLMAVTARFGLKTETREGLTGLWVGERKIASIGIAVKRWISLHGFALNINNDLEPFDWIHPCGLKGVRMTSLAGQTGHAIGWRELLEATCREFGCGGFSRPEWRPILVAEAREPGSRDSPHGEATSARAPGISSPPP